ncbi:MAG: hypothetical protein EOO50_07465 [Flavobacterium sp.]|uniref:hypothetical protein n=1 Tax=Flavobacterium sp. TaxID=239 RepID=UPI0012178ACC|nr:hypothetical protein [Flavobacterium sp.]RZJ67093.1 MAG: hypothetical protein EOO50_07465 [Flavobacterium sp.]
MSFRSFVIALFLIASSVLPAQETDATGILRTILKNYYKTEKPVYKGRQQLLFFFCDKANNNEEIFEAVQNLKLPQATVKQIRNTVLTDLSPASWQQELEAIYKDDQTKLQMKINDCLLVEQYQERRAKLNLNNQRLMIVSKPVLYDNNSKALVKVTFYRTIEHNNGAVVRMEKINGVWTIKEFLNEWAT